MPYLQNNQSKRVIIWKRICMIHSLRLIFQLCFDYPSSAAGRIDAPYILRITATPLHTDKSFRYTTTKNISGFGGATNTGGIAERFVQSWNRRGMQVVQSRITLVFGVSAILDRFGESSKFFRLYVRLYLSLCVDVPKFSLFHSLLPFIHPIFGPHALRVADRAVVGDEVAGVDGKDGAVGGRHRSLRCGAVCRQLVCTGVGRMHVRTRDACSACHTGSSDFGFYATTPNVARDGMVSNSGS